MWSSGSPGGGRAASLPVGHLGTDSQRQPLGVIPPRNIPATFTGQSGAQTGGDNGRELEREQKTSSAVGWLLLLLLPWIISTVYAAFTKDGSSAAFTYRRRYELTLCVPANSGGSRTIFFLNFLKE